MAFKMSPIGKKKCPYSPMQKKGLINPSPIKLEEDNTVSSSGGANTQIQRTKGVNTAFTGRDADSERSDLKNRTKQFNNSPEGRQMAKTLQAMGGVLGSGEKGSKDKDGNTYFTFQDAENNKQRFTRDDYDNLMVEYKRAKNATVGRTSLIESRASDGQQATYMNQDSMTNYVNTKDATGKGSRSININRNQAPYTGPHYGSDEYYAKVDAQNMKDYAHRDDKGGYVGNKEKGFPLAYDSFGFLVDERGARVPRNRAFNYRAK